MLESIYNKATGLSAYSFIKDTPTQVLSCECYKISQKNFFPEHLQTLLLAILSYLGKAFFQLLRMLFILNFLTHENISGRKTKISKRKKCSRNI